MFNNITLLNSIKAEKVNTYKNKFSKSYVCVYA